MVGDDLAHFVAADPLDRWSRLALGEIQAQNGQPRRGRIDLGRTSSQRFGSQCDPRPNRPRSPGNRKSRPIARPRPPRRRRVAQLRGAEALGRREAKKAVKQFRIAYAANPDDHETLFGLWAALELKGDEKEAAPIREAAKNLDRLNSLLQRGRTPQARHDLSVIRQFGTLCAALHRNAEARTWFQVAIDTNPLDSESQQALFRLHAQGQPP